MLTAGEPENKQELLTTWMGEAGDELGSWVLTVLAVAEAEDICHAA